MLVLTHGGADEPASNTPRAHRRCARNGFRARRPSRVRRDDHDERRRSRSGRRTHPDERWRNPSVPRDAREGGQGQRQAALGDPRDSRNLRRARAHPRRLPKAREEGLLRRGARALRPAGRRFEAPRYRRDSRSRRQGARRAGAFRSRRHGSVGKQHAKRRRFEARHHGILLGRTHHVALLGAQLEAQGRRRLVRKTHGRQGRSPPAPSRSKSATRSTRPCSASTARRIRAFLSTPSRR